MKTWAVLLAFGALLPLLAGCNEPPAGPAEEPVVSTVSAARLENGTFYAFQHRGGDLAVAVAGNGSAEVVLYGADDQRIGHVGVGAEQARGRFVLEDVEAGELVVHAMAVNGTLDLRSGGDRVDAFRALTPHVERHILAEVQPELLGSFGLPGDGEDVDQAVELDLLRSPTGILGAARAAFASLDITVTGRSGLVYEYRSGGTTPFASPPNVFLQPLYGEFHEENVRDGALTARVQASDFSGVLFLEVESYSRAAPVDGAPVLTAATPRFTYGELPDQPVSFEVRDGTRSLYLWAEGISEEERSEECDEPANAGQPRCDPDIAAHVALFDPQDRHVATLSVPGNGTLALPIDQDGSWVAVLLDGEATLGADRVPGDFELHPLDIVSVALPAEAAGEAQRSYGQDRRPLDAPGTPFRIQSTTIQSDGATGPLDPADFGPFTSCDVTVLSVLRDGETIAAWGYGELRFSGTQLPRGLDPTLLLADGELEVQYADFGRNCSRTGVLVDSYER